MPHWQGYASKYLSVIASHTSDMCAAQILSEPLQMQLLQYKFYGVYVHGPQTTFSLSSRVRRTSEKSCMHATEWKTL